jgi:hypothetical protein
MPFFGLEIALALLHVAAGCIRSSEFDPWWHREFRLEMLSRADSM